MALTGGDEIQIHQENDDHNDDHNDNDGNDQDTTRTAAVTGGAAGGQGTTNFNLRVEQNKIPEFFGSKSKDSISAADFIRQLEDLAKNKQVVGCSNLLPLRQLTPESGSRMALFSGQLG